MLVIKYCKQFIGNIRQLKFGELKNKTRFEKTIPQNFSVINILFK